MNQLELEREISKMSSAMMTRNTLIGNALIAHLRTQLTLDSLAGLMLVSIERVLWFDTDSVFWSLNHLIPADIMQEIQKITSVAVYQRLARKGFIPGQDFSVDAQGKLLLSAKTSTAILVR